MLKTMERQDQLVLITGTNRGIGYFTAERFAQLGYHVIMAARNKEEGEEAVASLKEYGYKVEFMRLDVTDKESCTSAFNTINEKYSKLDILINNAGVYLDANDRLLDIDWDVFEKTIQVNLMGPALLCKLFLPLMIKNGFGRIVNVTSGYGRIEHLDSTFTASYKLSKNALNGLTRLLAADLDGKNVKINALDPGWVRTDMGGGGASRSPEAPAKEIVDLAIVGEDGPNGKHFYMGNSRGW